MKAKTVFLLFIFTATGFAKFLVVFNYIVDFEHYVNVYCENKGDDSISCKGSCAFMKEMSLSEPNQQEKPVVPENETQFQSFELPTFDSLSFYAAFIQHYLNTRYLHFDYDAYLTAPFKPPKT